MDKKTKSLLIMFISFMIMGGCTTTNSEVNNPKTGITHTHNGIAHTHRLPTEGLKHSHNIGSGNAAQTCKPCANRNNTGGTCHLHEGRNHCHPLPASGTQHTHNNAANNTANNTANNNSSNPIMIYQPSTSTTTPYTNVPYTQPTIGVTPSPYYQSTQPTTYPADPYYRPAPTPTTPITYPPKPYLTHETPQSWTRSDCDTSSGNYYIVRAKDGVYRIGVTHGVKRNDIIRLNNLQSPDFTIHPGQCLRLR